MGFMEQVHTMPLTQHIMLAVLPDAGLRNQLICALAALRRGVQNLGQRYAELLAGPTADDAVRNPILSIPAPWPMWMSHGAVQYDSR